MNQCDGCRAGKPLVKLVNGKFVEAPDGDSHVMGSLEPGRYADLMSCERKRYEERQPFAATDDLEDAPDGAVIQREDGWWARSGQRWVPISAEEAQRLTAQALPNCSCDQRGRNISCERCR